MEELDPRRVRISGGFWAARLEINARSALLHQWDQLEQSGCIRNFRLAAGREQGAPVEGRRPETDGSQTVLPRGLACQNAGCDLSGKTADLAHRGQGAAHDPPAELDVEQAEDRGGDDEPGRGPALRRRIESGWPRRPTIPLPGGALRI